MKEKPSWGSRVQEAIEACRPGSDDLADPGMEELAAQLAADPELDALFQRSQRLDTVIRDAFADVPVPEGLEERLLARLAEARSEHTTQSPASEYQEPPPDESPQGEVATVTSPRRRRISRRWWAAVAGGAVAASVAVAFVFYLQMPAGISEAEVLRVAIDFYNTDSSDEGRRVSEQPPPRSYPFSRDVLRTAQTRWRPIDGFLGCRGVAYDLAGPGQARATLYVVRRELSQMKAAAPCPRPALTTAGRSISTWQSGDLLYVLVVQGGPRTYRRFLELPSGPLT